MRIPWKSLALAVPMSLLVACEQAPTSPAARSALTSPTAQAVTQAVTQIDHTVIPFDLIVFVSCANGGAGEMVEVSGPLSVLTRTTVSASGNVSYFLQYRPEGITASGLTTGTKYHAVGVTEFMGTSDGFPIISTFVNNFYLIGQGPQNNYNAHQTIHTVINANGIQTASVDNEVVTCH